LDTRRQRLNVFAVHVVDKAGRPELVTADHALRATQEHQATGPAMVHRARQGFVEQRTATLNRIRGLLAEVDAGEAMDEGSAVPGGAVERDGRRSAARRRKDGPRARDASRPCAGAAATRSSADRRRGPQPRTRSTRCSDTATTCAPSSQAKDMQRA
jgi:hypothetical protein